MNINEKIIDSVQKTTGLRCYEGEPGQLVRGSFAYFYPLQTASRGNEVAIFFFTRPTIERLDRRRSLDYAMTMANRWLNGLYTYSGLKFADVVSQNQFQDTGGGYGIGMRVVLIDEARNAGGVSVERVLLTLSVDPIGSATLSGAGKYIKGNNATAGATALHGFTFSKWTDGTSDVSTDNPYTFEIDADTSLVAVCTRNNYTLSLSGGTGVTSTTGGGSYPYEQTVTATAVLDSHYDFSNWTSGGTVVSSSNPYEFSLLADTTLQANATPKSYNVLGVSNDPTMGSVSGGGTYTYGDTVTLTATPVGDYVFDKWTVDGIQVSTDNPYVFNASESVIVQGNFKVNGVNVTVTVNDPTMGSASGGGSYTPGTVVTVTATANTGYEFVNWTKNGIVVSSSASYTFAALEDTTVTAVFMAEIKWFTVTALNNGFTMTMNKASGVSADPLEYSTDLTTWTTYTNNTTISLNANKSVYFRNRGGTYRGQGCSWSGNLTYYGYSCKQTSSGKTYKVSGHLATLFDPDESGDYTAYYVSLFNGETGLVDASGLVMDGVNKMYDNSAMYWRMFYGCTALVHGPKSIPQPRLDGSYSKDYQLAFNSMFQNCTSLVDMPSMDNVSIPIVVNIYRNTIFEYMFSGCTSLEDASDFTVPVSSFTSTGTNTSSTLYDGHFRSMFYGCTSLVHGPTIGTENSTFSIQSITTTSYRVAADPFGACFTGCSRLQDVTLNFVSMTNAWNAHNSSYNSSSRKWNTSYAFNNWLGNVAAEGTVYSKTAISPTGSTSNLPTGWTNTIIS